ncbi:UNVERIFIED_CONTAM: 60S ribosomal protein L6 [Sesamum indicum]
MPHSKPKPKGKKACWARRTGERQGVGISIGPRTYDVVLLERDIEGGHDEGKRLGCTECVGQDMGIACTSVVPFRDDVRDAKARMPRASASTWITSRPVTHGEVVTINNNTKLYESGNWNEYNLNPLTRIHWRASLVPAAVIQEPTHRAYSHTTEMAPKSARVSRNPEFIPGVRKISRSKMYHKRGLWAINAKNGGKFPHHDKAPAATPVVEKPPKFYPADDIKKPLSNKQKPKPTKLRASIIPGTLPSGLLLVTGPYKINGVPLSRVNQAYVIGTSTKVDISGVNVEKFDDKYFAKQVEKKKKKGESEFFEAEKQDKNTLPTEKKDDQKAVDGLLLKAIEAVADLKAYLMF